MVIIFMCRVIVFNVLNLAFSFSNSQHFNLQCAVIILKFRWVFAYFSTTKPLYKKGICVGKHAEHICWIFIRACLFMKNVSIMATGDFFRFWFTLKEVNSVREASWLLQYWQYHLRICNWFCWLFCKKWLVR